MNNKIYLEKNKNNKMRICFITEDLLCGGKERQLVELIKGLISRKLLSPEDIMIITMKSYGFYNDVLEEMGVEIEKVKRSFKKDIFKTFQLLRIIKRFKPDVIHSFSVMMTTYAVLMKLFYRFKLIDGSVRSAPSSNLISAKIKFLNFLNFRFADIIVSNSQAGHISFHSPINKSLVIFNGFDLKRIADLLPKEIIKKKFDLKSDTIIGMIANFNHKKDHGTFIKAAKILLQKRDDLVFITVGDGPLLKKFKEQVNTTYKDKIRFLGRQNNIESIINIFEIAVLTTHSEGLSNAILEYMSLGKPIITSDCAGTREVIQNGISGLLSELNSHVDLADKIEYLLQNTSLQTKMGRSARAELQDKFSLDKMVNSYFKLYRNLLDKKAGEIIKDFKAV